MSMNRLTENKTNIHVYLYEFKIHVWMLFLTEYQSSCLIIMIRRKPELCFFFLLNEHFRYVYIMRGSRKKFKGVVRWIAVFSRGCPKPIVVFGFFGGRGAILQCKRKFEISRRWGGHQTPPPNPPSRSAYVNMEI